MTSFWEQHEAAELEVAKAAELAKLEARRQRAASLGPSQNAPQQCSKCQHVGEDVLLGLCPSC